jgi:toxin ParE1/3/4
VTRYVLSPEAQQNLRDIREYLLREAGLRISRRVMHEIATAIRFLSSVPGAGHYRHDLTGDRVKFWQVYSYLIIYDHTARPIGIARVLHSSRDIAAVLARAKQ